MAALGDAGVFGLLLGHALGVESELRRQALAVRWDPAEMAVAVAAGARRVVPRSRLVHLHAVLRTAGVATAIVAVTTALDVGDAAGVISAVIAIGAERQQKLGRSMFTFPGQGGPMESH